MVICGAFHNPTRERGTELRRFRDDCDPSLAHASGYETLAAGNPWRCVHMHLSSRIENHS